MEDKIKTKIETLYPKFNVNTKTPQQSKIQSSAKLLTTSCEVCKIRSNYYKSHTSHEEKNITLSSTELKYAGANHNGMTKSQLKKLFKNSVSTTRQNTKKDLTRHPKNLLHLNFEDERSIHSTCIFAKEQSLEIR